MNSTTERLLETLLSQHDQIFRDFFAVWEADTPITGSDEYKARDEAFDRVIADMIRACEPGQLADVITDSPSGVDVDHTIQACAPFEADAPGLSFLRAVAMQVITVHIFIRYTGSM
jgi:hypothetical protein